MFYDERDIRCSELRKIFREYMDMNNALGYLDGKLREDATDNVKEAYKEYIKLKKEIIEDRKKLPFV